MQILQALPESKNHLILKGHESDQHIFKGCQQRLLLVLLDLELQPDPV